ncbi:hypothetical protein [Streptomyces sp. SLBN-31]|nr:hypothetical protein [Streptomyces sp. SLBN-31]TQJ86097.1 hypothetical protein FBY22_4897 [Streptomyces sp. SLBN-31]
MTETAMTTPRPDRLRRALAALLRAIHTPGAPDIWLAGQRLGG